MQHLDFDAIGTKWRIETEAPLSAGLRQQLHERIEQFDKTYSRFRQDSQVAQVAQRAGRHVFPDDAAKLFAFYRLLYEVSEGKVTPLVGNSLEDIGYDAQYSLQAKKTIRPVVAWEQVMWWRGPELFTHIPIVLDIGAAGKGYLVELVAETLRASGVQEFIIDASGDILHNHHTPDRVGLEHPGDPSKIIGVAYLQGDSLCASAINRRSWGDMHHILDPHTAQPTRNVVATWVVAASTMLADGLATALFFTDPVKLREVFDFEYVRILQDGTIDRTPHFQGELYI